MRPPAAVALVVAAALGVSAYIVATKPDWYISRTVPLEYSAIIATHACNYDLPAPLIAAVIANESGFDPDAESTAGAVGLMQLTPDTGQGIADRTGGKQWTVDDLLDPELNIRYGAWYLSHLIRTFDDADDPTRAALAAYNGGQGNAREWLNDADGQLELDEIPFDETRAYVEDVERDEGRYADAYPDLASNECADGA